MSQFSGDQFDILQPEDFPVQAERLSEKLDCVSNEFQWRFDVHAPCVDNLSEDAG